MKNHSLLTRGLLAIACAVAIAGAPAALGETTSRVIGGAQWLANGQAEEARQLIVLDPSNGNFLAGRQITLSGQNVMTANAMAVHPSSGTVYAALRLIGQEGFELVTLDPVTGVATAIGNLGHDFAALAFRSDGTLYGVPGFRDTDPKTLYTIDMSTAAVTQVCTMSNGTDAQAIAFGPGDVLYHGTWSDSTDMIFETIDPTTCEATTIAEGPDGSSGPTALMYDGSDTFLEVDGNAYLYTLTTSGVQTLVGEIGLPTCRRCNTLRGLFRKNLDLPITDLTPTAYFTPSSVGSGQDVTLTITPYNLGQITATGVKAYVYLRTGLEYVSSSGDACSVETYSTSTSAQRLTCAFDDLVPAATDSVDIVLHSSLTSSYLSTYIGVFSDQWDATPDDNRILPYLYRKSSDMTIAMSAGKSPAKSGHAYTVPVTVTNHGGDSTTNVVASVPVPANTTFSSASGASCSGTSTVTCNLGSMGVTTTSFSLTFAVSLPGKSTLTVTGSVTSDNYDPNPGDNAASVSTKVVGKP